MKMASAVDCSADALTVYKLNHQSEAQYVSCASVGPEKTEFTLPPPRPNLHAHLSPPCVDLSNAKRGARSAEGAELLDLPNFATGDVGAPHPRLPSP